MAAAAARAGAQLLSGDEANALSALANAPERAQKLYWRLAARRAPRAWVRLRSLRAAADADGGAESAASELGAAGLVSLARAGPDDGSMPTKELLGALTVAELRAVARAANVALPPGADRAMLIACIGAHAAQRPAFAGKGSATPDTAVRAAALAEAGPLGRLTDAAADAAARGTFLYFLDHAAGLSTLFVASRGVVRFAVPEGSLAEEPGALALLAFPGGRVDLLRYEEARADRLLIEALAGRRANDASEAQDAVAQSRAASMSAEQALHVARAAIAAFRDCPGSEVPPRRPEACPARPLFLARYSSGWQRARAAWLAVSLLEGAREYSEAVGALEALLRCGWCLHKRGDMWYRLAVDLTHLGNCEAALSAAESAVDDPWVRGGTLVAAQRRVARMARPPLRDAHHAAAYRLMTAGTDPSETIVHARPLEQLDDAPNARSRFYGSSGDVMSVEQVVLEHYAAPENGGWRGCHDEGGTLRTLFGLLLWDALFDTSIPHAFSTRFQLAPLDLMAESFAPAREERIASVLEMVRAGGAPEAVRAAWDAHEGAMCTGVSWERHERDDLVQIAECIGGEALAGVLQLLADDYSAWSSGMPDLLLWSPCDGDGGRKSRARLAEVKGPNDALSEQQRAWCAALRRAGCDVEVTKVRAPPKRPAAGGFASWKANSGKRRARR